MLLDNMNFEQLQSAVEFRARFAARGSMPRAELLETVRSIAETEVDRMPVTSKCFREGQ